jgi:hypothetical protein
MAVSDGPDMGNSSDHNPSKTVSTLCLWHIWVYTVTRTYRQNKRRKFVVCSMRLAIWGTHFPLNAKNRIWLLLNCDVTMYIIIRRWSTHIQSETQHTASYTSEKQHTLSYTSETQNTVSYTSETHNTVLYTSDTQNTVSYTSETEHAVSYISETQNTVSYTSETQNTVSYTSETEHTVSYKFETKHTLQEWANSYRPDGSVGTATRLKPQYRRLRVQLRAWTKGFPLFHRDLTEFPRAISPSNPIANLTNQLQ